MSQPHILIFMSDQQRGDTILPDSPVQTPNLDRFIREGLLFSNARCPSPHCCPSRTTFFTGLFPSEHGVWNNVSVQNSLSRGPRSGTRFWNQDLIDAGYNCSFTGKWHVDFDKNPQDYGWKEYLVTAGKQQGDNWMGPKWNDYASWAQGQDSSERSNDGMIQRPGYGDYQHYGTQENPFNDQGVVTCAQQAIAEMASNTNGQPSCIFVGTLGPHDPYVPPQRFLDLYKDVEITLPENFSDTMADKPGLYRRTRKPFDQLTPEEHKEAIRHYWAFCSYEDWLFGQCLQTLEESAQADNTLVLYLSDHGDYCAEHGLWCKGLPCFKGAYEIPFAMRWPQGIAQPGRHIDAAVGLEDCARTLLEVAGCDATQWPGSGRSLVPFMKNKKPESWRSAHFTQSNGNELYGIQRSIDTGDWKYVYNGFDLDELYDLTTDPGETINLAAHPEHQEQRNALCARMWSFACEHDDHSTNPYVMVALAPVGPKSAFDASGTLIPSGG